MPHTGLETLHVPICIPRVVTWECVWVPRQDAHGRRGTADGDRGFLFPRPRLSTQTGQLAALTGPCEAAAGAILPLSRLQKLRQPKAMGTSLRPTARQWGAAGRWGGEGGRAGFPPGSLVPELRPCCLPGFGNVRSASSRRQPVSLLLMGPRRGLSKGFHTSSHVTLTASCKVGRVEILTPI